MSNAKIVCRRILSGSSLILCAAMMMETLGIGQLVSGKAAPAESAIVFFGAHAAASVLFALALPRLLPSSCRSSTFSSTLPFVAVTLFMPLLGMLGTLIFLLSIPRQNHDSFGQSLAVALHGVPSLPKLPKALEKVSGPLDWANIAGILSRSKDQESRLRAIIFTLKLKDKDAVSLLRIGLKDPVDDIRLLAYSLLNRKEKTIYDRIDSTTARLRELGSYKNTQLLYKDLVCAYWDLVYFGLAEAESARFLLGKAREVAVEGLERYPNSAGLYFQLGRILLFQREIKEAASAFQQAKVLGTDERKLLPYLAEIAYRERRFRDVKRLLDEIGNGPRPLLSATGRLLNGGP